MKKWFIMFAAVVALPLLTAATCADVTGEITGATVTPQVAQVLVDSYNTAEGVGNVYLQLPLCGSPNATAVCRTKAISQKIFSELRIHSQDRNAVVVLLRANNGGSIPVASYNTLMAVYNTLKSDLVTTGISTGS
jgi:hypothetical protein